MNGAKRLLVSAAALLILAGCGKSNEEQLARMASIEARVTDLKALNEKLSADLKQQQAQFAGQVRNLDAALKDALAAEQQGELALRKALETNAAACEAQKAEIAKLKEQVAERTTRLADTLKAREFQLVDADGRPRVHLHLVETAGADDRPALEFFDRRGENLASYNPEGVFLTQNVRGSHERTSFWTGGVSITRQSHNIRLCTTETSSFINFDDRATLMATETGVDLTLSDSNGAHRAAVSLSNRDGPSVTLFDSNMKPRIALDARKSTTAVEPADALPGVRVMDADGKLRLGLGSGPWTSAKTTGAADTPDYSLVLFGKDGSAIYKAP